MQQQILSRSHLEPVIRDLKLYQNDIDRLAMEELVDRLRQAITVSPVAPMRKLEPRIFQASRLVSFIQIRTCSADCAKITSMFLAEIRNQPIRGQGKYGFPEYGSRRGQGKLDEQDAKLADSSASTSARFQNKVR